MQRTIGNRSKSTNMSALQASWQAFDNMAHLRPIHTEADYDRTVKMMNALLDVTGDDEDHPLSGLLDLTSDLVSSYEQEHHRITNVGHQTCGKRDT